MAEPIETVAMFAKNRRESLRVALDEFRGHNLLDIRVCVPLEDGGEPRPTGKGVSLGITHLRELRKALMDAEALAIRMGWLTPEVHD